MRGTNLELHLEPALGLELEMELFYSAQQVPRPFCLIRLCTPS